MKIITNNIPRNLIYGYELTEKEKSEFDYLDSEEIETHAFFRYRGQVYDLSEFVKIIQPGKSGNPFAHCDHSGELKGWHGIQTDSFFSAVVVRFPNDSGETVVVGLALS